MRCLIDSNAISTVVDVHRTVISYCTGGIRSGWLVALLVDLNFPTPRNYAGSMWEWSASDPSTHPLE